MQNSPTKSRSSKSFASSASPLGFERVARPLARLALLFAFAVVFATLGGIAPQAASASPTYVDKHVSAIPSRVLMSEPAARLVDERRQGIGRRLQSYQRPLFFAWAFAQIAAFVFLWASGNAARLRDALRARIRNTVALRAIYGAALVAISGVASFPFALARYRIDYTFGLTAERAAGWYRDNLIAGTLDCLVVGAIVAGVFALVDRTRLWYAYTTAGLVVVTLVMAFVEPLVVTPLYNTVTPLSATSPVRPPLAALAARAGVGFAPIDVRDDSRQRTSVSADVEGFGPTTRIVLGDALLANATRGEVEVLAARELGHYAHADTFRLSLFWTALFIVCTALAVFVADRVAFRRDDDPLARLALVFGFLGLFALVATPIYNGYSRNLESRADSYALALTGERASAVRVYLRIADETLAPLCPARWERVYFYNSPPLGTRIAKAAGRPDPCR